MKKRVLSMVLCMCLLLMLLPAEAVAAEDTLTTWDALKTAVESATEDTTISVSGELTRGLSEATITVPAGRHITLMGAENTKIVRNIESVGEFVVPETSTLTLQGDWTISTGKGDKGQLSLANFVKVETGGTLNLEAKVRANTQKKSNQPMGKAALIYCQGTMTMADGAAVSGWTIYDTDWNPCSAIAVDGPGAAFTMNGGIITENYNEGPNGVRGAAVQILNNAAFTMNGGSITENGYHRANQEGVEKYNESNEYGSGVYVKNSSFTMNGGEISNNTGCYGAGVYVKGTAEQPAALTIANGKLVNNKLSANGNIGCGGAVYAEYANVTISDTSLIGNGTQNFGALYQWPQTSGGGLYLDHAAAVLKNVSIENGKTSGNNNQGGAGIFVNSSTLTMTDGSISNNQAGDTTNQMGGGLRIDGNSNVTLNYVTISGNQAAPNANPKNGDYGRGGGIMVNGNNPDATQLVLNNCIVAENAASFCGGGICVYDGTVAVNGGTVIGNKALNDIGGGICIVRSAASVTGDAAVSGNVAGTDADKNDDVPGDGVYVEKGSSFHLQDTAQIAPNNDVTIEDGAFINISAPYTGAATESPVCITSEKGDIETGDVPGTKLVQYTENAGGVNEAMIAAGKKVFVPSVYMKDDLYIGQSQITKDILTYVADPQHLVTFLPGDHGTLAGDAAVLVNENGKVPSAPAVTVTGGHEFIGWKSDIQDDSKLYTAEDILALSITGNVTFTAQYKETTPPTPPTPSKPDRPSRPSRPTPPADLNTEEHFSYIVGYKDGTIRPYNTITRGEVATIFFRLLTDKTRDKYWCRTNDYTDVPADLWCNNAISTLSSMGIIDGFADGSFQPRGTITRAQFAKMAVGFFETTAREYEGCFTDVAPDAWYTSYVEAAARVGLISGFEDGTFRPDAKITRAQACVIVNRALDRHPDEDHLLPAHKMLTWPDNNPGDWFYADMQEATNSHDYRMETKRVHGEKIKQERWTGKLSQRDWAAFENAWANAHSAHGGGDVVA